MKMIHFRQRFDGAGGETQSVPLSRIDFTETKLYIKLSNQLPPKSGCWPTTWTTSRSSSEEAGQQSSLTPFNGCRFWSRWGRRCVKSSSWPMTADEREPYVDNEITLLLIGSAHRLSCKSRRLYKGYFVGPFLNPWLICFSSFISYRSAKLTRSGSGLTLWTCDFRIIIVMVDLWTSLLYSYPPITIDAASRVSSIIDSQKYIWVSFFMYIFLWKPVGFEGYQEEDRLEPTRCN